MVISLTVRLSIVFVEGDATQLGVAHGTRKVRLVPRVAEGSDALLTHYADSNMNKMGDEGCSYMDSSCMS